MKTVVSDFFRYFEKSADKIPAPRVRIKPQKIAQAPIPVEVLFVDLPDADDSMIIDLQADRRSKTKK